MYSFGPAPYNICLPASEADFGFEILGAYFFNYRHYAGQMILELSWLLELFKDILLKDKKKRNLQYALSSGFKDKFTLFS